MPVLKKPRHEKAAMLIATKDISQLEAYVGAGFANNDANCYRLFRRPEVMARIAEIQGRAAEKASLTRSWVLDRLMDNARRCLDPGSERNPGAANRALELLGKEIGMFVDRRLLGIGRIEDMSEEELLEFLGGEPEAKDLREAAGSPPVGHA